MTTQFENQKSSKKPTHTLRKKYWNGKRTDFETLGVAWQNDDGSLYIKLYGTQVIDSGFHAFPNKEETTTKSGQ